MNTIGKKKTSELNFGDVSVLLSAGAATGMTIAKFAGKNEQIGGMIGAGLSLLVTGLMVAADADIPQKKTAIEVSN